MNFFYHEEGMIQSTSCEYEVEAETEEDDTPHARNRRAVSLDAGMAFRIVPAQDSTKTKNENRKNILKRKLEEQSAGDHNLELAPFTVLVGRVTTRLVTIVLPDSKRCCMGVGKPTGVWGSSASRPSSSVTCMITRSSLRSSSRPENSSASQQHRIV